MSYKVYGIKNDVDFFYFGTTRRSLKTRFSEHISFGTATRQDEIRLITETDTHEMALLKETTLISLYGLGRLRNKKYEQNNVSEAYNCFKRVSQRKKKIKKGMPLKWTEERRAKSIASMTGAKKNPHLLEMAMVKNGAKYFDLYVYDKHIGRFISQTEAARAIGLPKSTFVNIIKGLRIKTKGIVVQYVS